MNLISADAYWRLQNGLIASYPTLHHDLKCEALVVGGGISGALLLDRLTRNGVNAVMIERFDIGSGSTSGSTGLLQYEIDVELQELSFKLGRDHAERAYWSCHRAIDTLEGLSKELGLIDEFQRKQSLYLAVEKDDLPQLQKEFLARKSAGFNVEYLNTDDIKKRFSISRPGAIFSYQAAEVDPYLLTHRLIQRAASRGAKVYDRTGLKDFDCVRDGVRVTTSTGARIQTRRLIFATGYEAVPYLPKGLVDLTSSFALATKPVHEPKSVWPDKILLWETARPYHYVRTTADNRLIIGGEDEPFRNPAWRDRVLPVKAEHLWAKLEELFPRLELEFGYHWAGTFGETADGLPYIGEIEKYPGVLFACGYGGNGITYSCVAAEIITEAVLGREHHDAELFAFDRESTQSTFMEKVGQLFSDKERWTS